MLHPLPIDAVLPELVALLRQSRSVVLRAPTGAGKSTRVPVAIHDAGLTSGQIVVLEPRRLAARAAARRMAQERGQNVGELVGYHVRFERQAGPHTRIIVMTPGLLLRLLHEDPALSSVGAVIFDEFHERALDNDLALGVVRALQMHRPDLHVIVMSATLATGEIAAYLGNGPADPCPVVVSEGRSYPVEILYEPPPAQLSYASAAAEAVRRILPRAEGDVLCFLPGKQEIRQAAEELKEAAAEAGVLVLPLHGDLPAEEQDRALSPQSRRRVVLATNIAETSVTVEGVSVVVDVGVARMQTFDTSIGMDRLPVTSIARDAADQRAGRAGRVAPGVCLRLWSQQSHDQRAEQTPPEIQRVDLAGAVLRLLELGETDVRNFLWLEPPCDDAIDQALTLLRRLGAVEGAAITDLGRWMGSMPVHPRLARMLTQCHNPAWARRIALAAALLSERDPFARVGQPNWVRREPSRSDVLDRVAALEAYELGAELPSALGPLNEQAAYSVLRVRDQLLRDLQQDPPPATPAGALSADEAVLRALLLAFPDRVARRQQSDPKKAEMVGGVALRFSPFCAVSAGTLLLCIEAGGEPQEIRLGSTIDRDWLATTSDVRTFFDHGSERVVARQRICYEDLLLEETPAALPTAEEVSRLLARAARKRIHRVHPPPDSPAGSFLRRLNWLRQQMPELSLPELGDDELREFLPQACLGCRSFDEVRRADWLRLLQSKLTHVQLQAVESEAPERVMLPSGRSLKVGYEPEFAAAKPSDAPDDDTENDGEPVRPHQPSMAEKTTTLIQHLSHGRLTEARSTWSAMISSHRRPLRLMVNRVYHEACKPLALMALPGQAPGQYQELARWGLAELSDVLAKELCHLLLHRAQYLDKLGMTDEAGQAFLGIFTLDRGLGCINEDVMEDVADFLLGSGVPETYVGQIPQDYPRGEEVFALVKEGASGKRVLAERIQLREEVDQRMAALRDLEASGSDDLPQWLSSAERLSQLFRDGPKELQRVIRGNLLGAFKIVRRKRSSWARRQMAPEVIDRGRRELTRALLWINEALRRRQQVTDHERFHDLHDLHQCLRLQPELLDEAGGLVLFRGCLREARELGLRLRESPDFQKHVLFWPNKKADFLSQLGEICKAHYDYDVVEYSELGPILQQAVEFFREALAQSDPPVPQHVKHNCARMAVCLRFLRRYEDSIEQSMRIYDLCLDSQPRGPGDNQAAWEACRNIAECNLALALRDGRDDRGQAALRFDEAERWYLTAARVWEPGVDPRLDRCRHHNNRTLSGTMAWFYFQRGDYRQAEIQARRTIEMLPPEHSARDARGRAQYVLGWVLERQRRDGEALEILEQYVSEDVDELYLLRTYVLIMHLYTRQSDEVNLGRTRERMTRSAARVAARLGLPPLPELPLECLMLFVHRPAMELYATECQRRLDRGEARAVLSELMRLRDASRYFQKGLQENLVFLGLLARAQRHVGNYDEALRTLQLIRSVGPHGSSLAHALLVEGLVHLDQGHPERAAASFESCWDGWKQVGTGGGAALLLAARACRQARLYDRALEHLATLAASGLDKEEGKSRAERAWVYWHRYRDQEAGVGGNEQDVTSACWEVLALLRGPAAGLLGWHLFILLTDMADHPDAQGAITEVLERADAPDCLRVIRRLANAGRFAGPVRVAVLRALDRHRPVSDLRAAAAHFVFASWADAYLREDRRGFEAFVRQDLAELHAIDPDLDFWCLLLARNNRALEARLVQRLDEGLLRPLRPPPGLSPAELTDYYRDRIVPLLNCYLETSLHGLTPAAYSGADPGGSFQKVAQELLDHWPRLKDANGFDLGWKVVTKLATDSEGDYPVSEHQRHFALVFLNDFCQSLGVQIPPERMAEIAMALERGPGVVRVRIRVKFAEGTSEEVRMALVEDMRDGPVLRKWLPLLKRSLPEGPTWEYRPQRLDAMLTLPLRVAGPIDQAWRLFYERAVCQGEHGADPVAFQELKNCTRPAWPVRSTVSGYVPVHFDGVFVRTFAGLGPALTSKIHGLRNFIRDAIFVGGEEVTERLPMAVNRFAADLLEGHTLNRTPFDLESLLRDLLEQCQSFLSGIHFDLQVRRYAAPPGLDGDRELLSAASAVGNCSVIIGSREHLRMALWDVLHNASRALRQAEPGWPRQIRLRLTPHAEGLELAIDNSGVPSLGPDARGQGIGSRTVRRVIMEMHGGTVEHGTLDDPPYRYRWQLSIPWEPS